MTRRAALPLPRFVSHASIDEGDTVRVTWKVGQVEHSRTGTVHRIIHDSYKAFIAEDGNEIARFTRDTKCRFTLLAEAQHAEPLPLFGDELMERIM